MSTAFLKEDAPDRKVFIPPRAPLPPGVTNYVTPRGLARLQQERADLEAERTQVQTHETDEAERTRKLAELNGRLAELQPRLASAKVLDPQSQPQDEVRFGATVTLHPVSGKGQPRQLTFVGVDEAAASEGRIAFTAPIAHQFMGRHVGDRVTLRSRTGEETMQITAIAYD
ncbi:transcription elongation factor GreB [Catalinimonas alkaloidigena]|uniref:Transcription elongation factor GreB n=1 Tax=Catalinimonas alkaloidigena TaxID=1075417 RepID=A0A1G9GH61_9BACT|nr:GreA/GreB family elongation factor [Catalinimonas alkaloidigena]SDK99855.1 transcription elongation factor GreB [Catalinimonas alkaloidigena]